LKKLQIFYESLHSSENVLKSHNLYKGLIMALKSLKIAQMAHITGKSLHFPLNDLKKPRVD
jgi:phosphoribosylaminoimidazole (AIR) synthetase